MCAIHDSCSGVVSETDDNRFIKLGGNAISIIYRGLTTIPCQDNRAAMLIYLVATICYEIARSTTPSGLTASLLIVCIVIAVEAFLWVVATQLLWFIIINVPILLVALICYYKDIRRLLIKCSQKVFRRESLSTADQMVDLEAQVTEIIGNQTIV